MADKESLDADPQQPKPPPSRALEIGQRRHPAPVSVAFIEALRDAGAREELLAELERGVSEHLLTDRGIRK